MRKIVLTIALFVSLGVSPAYAENGGLIGGLLGAALGGFFGNQFGHGFGKDALTFSGVVAGGLIGNHIGNQIDQESRYYGSGAAFWSPDSDMFSDRTSASQYVANYVAPDAPSPGSFGVYNAAYETYCRPFVQQVVAGNHVIQSYVTACQQPDGSWMVLQ